MDSCPSLQWCGNNSLFLYEYIPWRSSKRNEITNLILDFKKDYPYAVSTVQMKMAQAFATCASYLRDTLHCRYIVTIPSSQQWGLNKPCERICEALAVAFPWLTYLPECLQRIQTVPKSARSEAGMRPDYATHVSSICYAGPRLNLAKQSFIMVDDIFTRGETSRACRDILMRATRCERAVGLFVGKTLS